MEEMQTEEKLGLRKEQSWCRHMDILRVEVAKNLRV